MSRPTEPCPDSLTKQDFERLSHFRYRLRCFLRQSEDICRDHGLTPLQYQLLLHLKGFTGREWASVGELAERLQAKHHGTVALVGRCEEAGLVERRPGRADRRRMEVHLLARGADLAERIAALHQPELRHLQEEFSLPGWEGEP
ncbi:MarR family winged helix-turn-helix transcriptional regulator [Halomonas rhizosphaerae]|uniref:MarR family winged helix-turn-helix transcriptional regulator n=1 Tax=Halomonas rhizosphaerae TaxID=3043296 RepID=A0ABT6V4M2_9GAMM|nr:MarR family winged helix-turn-helix transcriptional regulator [Halomonas rhizosphaerae]MDI5893169.1 MarR family winged helix-turn-helix transcriptional regulator [Halomonas rhizosphaerae]